MAPAAPLNLLIYLLLLACLSSRGTVLSQPCGPSNIQVNQHLSGAREALDSEFVVEIKNACACSQGDVRIYAPGFVSQKLVDPRVFRPDGGTFLVNGGNPIPAGSTVKFSYWWDRASRFYPASSLPRCP
ncbi:hypothetical protein Taro_027814 [Colocasia esculenta]|uniref:Uncharacterized protein n=1 Tax=Colocasia esculenta TaxID=4460 RepID=A0A843VL83_COLES|nr:hypothetical protein [Colocasia esculenta]